MWLVIWSSMTVLKAAFLGEYYLVIIQSSLVAIPMHAGRQFAEQEAHEMRAHMLLVYREVLKANLMSRAEAKAQVAGGSARACHTRSEPGPRATHPTTFAA